MNRDYTSGSASKVKTFIGYEVEKTPAYNMKTLFVADQLPLHEILNQAYHHRVDHIYLGANQSFSVKLPHGTHAEQHYWDEVVKGLLEAGYWVTLDYDISYHEWIIESGFNENIKFISMISVKLPYLRQLNYHSCLKIDDQDFKATNEGVWVHSVHDLLDRDKFTPWSEYENDSIITKEN